MLIDLLIHFVVTAVGVAFIGKLVHFIVIGPAAFCRLKNIDDINFSSYPERLSDGEEVTCAMFWVFRFKLRYESLSRDFYTRGGTRFDGFHLMGPFRSRWYANNRRIEKETAQRRVDMLWEEKKDR